MSRVILCLGGIRERNKGQGDWFCCGLDSLLQLLLEMKRLTTTGGGKKATPLFIFVLLLFLFLLLRTLVRF